MWTLLKFRPNISAHIIICSIKLLNVKRHEAQLDLEFGFMVDDCISTRWEWQIHRRKTRNLYAIQCIAAPLPSVSNFGKYVVDFIFDQEVKEKQNQGKVIHWEVISNICSLLYSSPLALVIILVNRCLISIYMSEELVLRPDVTLPGTSLLSQKEIHYRDYREGHKAERSKQS
jgi:hypothetical protein